MQPQPPDKASSGITAADMVVDHHSIVSVVTPITARGSAWLFENYTPRWLFEGYTSPEEFPTRWEGPGVIVASVWIDDFVADMRRDGLTVA